MAQGLVVTIVGGVVVAVIVAAFNITPKQRVVVSRSYHTSSGRGRVWKWVMTLGAVVFFAGLVFAGAQANGPGFTPGMYEGYGIAFFGVIIWCGGKFGKWITG